MMMKRFCLFAACACLLVDMSYAQRKVEVVETPQNSQAATSEKVIKRKVAIGRFSNETQYAKGIFYDKENDPMGKQALDILSAKLAASNSSCWNEVTCLLCLKKHRKARMACPRLVPII